MKLGIVLDSGDPKCKHQSLASLCGYEYCLSCDYKFIGHCTKCAQRAQKLEDFIKEKLEIFYKKKSK